MNKKLMIGIAIVIAGLLIAGLYGVTLTMYDPQDFEWNYICTDTGSDHIEARNIVQSFTTDDSGTVPYGELAKEVMIQKITGEGGSGTVTVDVWLMTALPTDDAYPQTPFDLGKVLGHGSKTGCTQYTTNMNVKFTDPEFSTATHGFPLLQPETTYFLCVRAPYSEKIHWLHGISGGGLNSPATAYTWHDPGYWVLNRDMFCGFGTFRLLGQNPAILFQVEDELGVPVSGASVVLRGQETYVYDISGTTNADGEKTLRPEYGETYDLTVAHADCNPYYEYDLSWTTSTSHAVIMDCGGSSNNPPYTPSNPNPSNGATGVSVTTSISWTGGDPDGDTTYYDVYFGTDSTPGSSELVSSHQTATSYNPPGDLSEDTTYYWRIEAEDNHGKPANPQGPTWSFTTEGNDPNPEDPTASFTWLPTSPVIDEEVQFTDTSTAVAPAMIVTWAWDFGDGTTPSSLQHPTHIFETAEEFSVSLTVTDNNARTNTKVNSVTVTEGGGNNIIVTTTPTACNVRLEENGIPKGSGISDAITGVFTFPNLPDGTYQLYTTKEGYVGDFQSVIVDGNNVLVTVTLPLVDPSILPDLPYEYIVPIIIMVIVAGIALIPQMLDIRFRVLALIIGGFVAVVTYLYFTGLLII